MPEVFVVFGDECIVLRDRGCCNDGIGYFAGFLTTYVNRFVNDIIINMNDIGQIYDLLTQIHVCSCCIFVSQEFNLRDK